MRTAVLLLGALLGPGCGSGRILPGSPGPAPATSPPLQVAAAVPPALEPVRAACEELVRDRKVPSIAVAVAQHGRVVWEQAFGYADVESKRPATTDTMYILASTGKSITGTAVMWLAERGLLDLDAPANRYLGSAGLRMSEGEASTVTVRKLLAMGVAIPHLWWHHWSDRPGVPLGPSEIVGRYGLVTAPPDGGFHYSNTTYAVLAQIVENVTRVPFGAFVERELFAPLGMNHAGLHPEQRFEPSLARPYSSTLERMPYLYSDPEAAAGWRVSAHDLIAYAMAHLGGRAPALLRPETLSAIHRPQGSFYFAGWADVMDRGGTRVAMADGSIVGGSSAIKLVAAADLAVACVTNVPGTVPDRVVDDVIAAFVPGYKSEIVVPEALVEHRERIESTLGGTWRGEVRTWEGAWPLTLIVALDGAATMAVGGASPRAMRDAQVDRGVFSATCDCAVPSSDARGENTELAVELRRAGDHLYGDGRIVSVAPRASFSLPAYVTLRR